MPPPRSRPSTEPPPSASPSAVDRIDEHADFLRRLARGLVGGDEHLAADLAQQTLLVALEKPPTQTDSSRVRSWLATVARRLVANDRRGERRRRARERLVARDEAGAAPSATGAEALERLELVRAIADRVVALDEPYRTAVYLRYHEGLGPIEIATRLGIPVKTVKTRLARALGQLRARLDTDQGGRNAWTASLTPWLWPSPNAALSAAGAGGGAGTGLAATLLTTGILMKKTLIGFAALAVAWFGLRALWTPSSGPVPAGFASAPAAGTDAFGPVATPAPRAAAPRTPLPDVSDASTTAAVAAAPTCALRVRLVWADDRSPVADLRVDVFCAGDPAPRDETIDVISDADGRLELPTVFVGRVSLRTAFGHRLDTNAPAPDDRVVEFELARHETVRGQVLAPDGSPVAGAELWTAGHAGRWPSGHRLGRADGSGRFMLHGLAPQASFGARAPGFRPSITFAPNDLPAAVDGAREVTLQLGAPGGSLHGVVRRPDGTPIAGARVRAGPRAGFSVDLPSGLRGAAAVPVPIETAEDGSFAVPHDLEPGSQPVHVAARGFPIWSGSATIRAGEPTALDITLDAPARIVGRVVRPDGTPVADARVVASREIGGGWHFDPFSPSRDTSAADGTFALGWVAPGERELNAHVPHHTRLGRARATVLAVADRTVEAELVLDVGRTIHGRVVDGDGTPLVGWGVWGDPSHQGQVYPRQDRTDDAGRFVLANLAGGDSCTWRLRVAAPGQFPHPPRAEQHAVAAGTDDVELVVVNATIAGSCRLTGRVLAADGRVPREVRVTVWGERGDVGSFAAVDPESGAFEYSAPVPGRYVVKVLRGGQTAVSSDVVDLRSDRVVDVGLLQLATTTSSVVVTIDGLDAAARRACRVTLDADHAATEHLTLGDDGTFRSRALAAGDWTLRVRGIGKFVPDRRVSIRPDSGETSVGLVARDGVELRLVVEAANDEAWGVVDVEVRSPTGELLHAGRWRHGPRREGPFRVPDVLLPPGDCAIEAWTETGRRGGMTLTLDPRNPSTLGPHVLVMR